MTDSPRFKPFTGNPDTAHLDYHGGRLVDFLLRRADRRRAAANARRSALLMAGNSEDGAAVADEVGAGSGP